MCFARGSKAILSETLRMGYSVTKIVEDINAAFSSALVIICSLVLVVTVANIWYNLIDIFFDPWNGIKAVVLIKHLSENAAFVTSLAVTSHCGQRLKNRRSEAKQALEDVGRKQAIRQERGRGGGAQ